MMAQRILDRGLAIAEGRDNELSPVGAIYLSYSALRSFLWAVFRSDLAIISLHDSEQGRLQHR